MKRLYRAEDGTELTIDIPIEEDIPRTKRVKGKVYKFVPEFSSEAVHIPLMFRSEEINRNRPNFKNWGISGKRKIF